MAKKKKDEEKKKKKKKQQEQAPLMGPPKPQQGVQPQGGQSVMPSLPTPPSEVLPSNTQGPTGYTVNPLWSKETQDFMQSFFDPGMSNPLNQTNMISLHQGRDMAPTLWDPKLDPDVPEPTTEADGGIGARVLGVVTGAANPLSLFGSAGRSINEGIGAIRDATSNITEPVREAASAARERITRPVDKATDALQEGPLGRARQELDERSAFLQSITGKVQEDLANVLGPSDLQDPSYAAESGAKLFGDEGIDAKTLVGRILLGFVAPDLARSLTEAGLQTMNLPANRVQEARADQIQGTTAQNVLSTAQNAMQNPALMTNALRQQAGAEAALATIGGGPVRGDATAQDIGMAAAGTPNQQLRRAAAAEGALRGDAGAVQGEGQLRLQEYSTEMETQLADLDSKIKAGRFKLDEEAQRMSQEFGIEELKLAQRRESLKVQQFIADENHRKKMMAINASINLARRKQWEESLRLQQEGQEMEARRLRAEIVNDTVFSKFMPLGAAANFAEVAMGVREASPEVVDVVEETQQLLLRLQALRSMPAGGGGGFERERLESLLDLYDQIGKELGRNNKLLEDENLPEDDRQLVAESVSQMLGLKRLIEMRLDAMGVRNFGGGRPGAGAGGTGTGAGGPRTGGGGTRPGPQAGGGATTTASGGRNAQGSGVSDTASNAPKGPTREDIRAHWEMLKEEVGPARALAWRTGALRPSAFAEELPIPTGDTAAEIVGKNAMPLQWEYNQLRREMNARTDNPVKARLMAFEEWRRRYPELYRAEAPPAEARVGTETPEEAQARRERIMREDSPMAGSFVQQRTGTGAIAEPPTAAELKRLSELFGYGWRDPISEERIKKYRR